MSKYKWYGGHQSATLWKRKSAHGQLNTSGWDSGVGCPTLMVLWEPYDANPSKTCTRLEAWKMAFGRVKSTKMLA